LRVAAGLPGALSELQLWPLHRRLRHLEINMNADAAVMVANAVAD
jgi:hypothetical protein